MKIPRIIVPAIRFILGLFSRVKLFEYLLRPIVRTTFWMNTVADYECEVTLRKLQLQSPKATGLLAQSWRIASATYFYYNLPNAQVRIVNDAPNAWYRIVGRAPGRMPPVTAIRNWCEVKGIDPIAAYPIARNIARRGTQRWQQESNVLNYLRSTNEYAIPNPWSETIDRIERALQP